MWCGDCRTLSRKFDFHARDQVLDEDENERFENRWKEKTDEAKYREVRSGDDIFVPFECENCVFIKLKRCSHN